MEFRKIVVPAFVAAVLSAGLVVLGFQYGIHGLPTHPPGPIVLQNVVQNPRLIIMDDHLVAWMPVNNWFANDGVRWKVKEEHWKGLLFQLGVYRGLDETTGAPDPTWTPEPREIVVTIEGSGSASPLNYTVSNYDRWINVMAVNTSGRPQHPDERNPTNEPMDQSRACVLAPGMPARVPTGQVCTEVATPQNPLECLRRKSLHRGFLPYRVLTYWPGPKVYELKAKRNGHFHSEYEFTLLDPIRVTVDGIVPPNLGTIVKIVVWHNSNYPVGPNRHMDTEDPPWPIP